MLIFTGFPRSGSESVHQALEILGYNTIWGCFLTSPGNMPRIEQELTKHRQSNIQAIISNGLITNHILFCLLLQFICPNDKIILIKRRNIQELSASLRNFGIYDTREMEDREHILINRFSNQIADFYIEDKWIGLCRILGLDIPNCPFPHINKGAANYQI